MAVAAITIQQQKRQQQSGNEVTNSNSVATT
jgi:hypothetical protein